MVCSAQNFWNDFHKITHLYIVHAFFFKILSYLDLMIWTHHLKGLTKNYSMNVLVLKLVTPNSSYDQLKKTPKVTKYPFAAWAIAFGTLKLTPLRIEIWAHHWKGLTKSYWMHVLVLKSVTPCSNYGVSKLDLTVLLYVFCHSSPNSCCVWKSSLGHITRSTWDHCVQSPPAAAVLLQIPTAPTVAHSGLCVHHPSPVTLLHWECCSQVSEWIEWTRLLVAVSKGTVCSRP